MEEPKTIVVREMSMVHFLLLNTIDTHIQFQLKDPTRIPSASGLLLDKIFVKRGDFNVGDQVIFEVTDETNKGRMVGITSSFYDINPYDDVSFIMKKVGSSFQERSDED